VLSPTDPSRLVLHCCSERGGEVTDAVTQLNLDYRRDFEGVLQTIKVGGLATYRKKDITSLLTPDPLGCFYCGYYASMPADITSVFHAGNI
ncbi:hypothetical protein, partial [Mesorhizobium japonicum]